MKAYVVMVRREFWEHRALWMAPLVLASLYVLLCLIPVDRCCGLSRQSPTVVYRGRRPGMGFQVEELKRREAACPGRGGPAPTL